MINYQTRKQIKYRAKEILRNNFFPLLLLAIAINITTIFDMIKSNAEYLNQIQDGTLDVMTVFQQSNEIPVNLSVIFIPLFVSLIISILIVPFSGVVLDIIRSDQQKANVNFDAFKVVENPKFWLTIIVCGIVEVIAIFFATMLFIIPGLIVAIFFSLSNYVILDIYRGNSEFVVIDNKSYETHGILSPLIISWNLIRGHALDYFVLILSFFPWYLLESITFGISGIYSIPYVTTTYAVWYDELLKEKHISF